MESNLTFPVKNQTSCNITGLSPGTSYTFSIISVTTNETLNKTITTGKGQGKQGWWLQQQRHGVVRREVWSPQGRTHGKDHIRHCV
jgi:hypothetical protein